jgi:hypothetical protein
MKRVTARYIDATLAGERYRAFVPATLPPEPPLELDTGLLTLLEKANRALGRLDGIADVLPDTGLFLGWGRNRSPRCGPTRRAGVGNAVTGKGSRDTWICPALCRVRRNLQGG